MLVNIHKLSLLLFLMLLPGLSAKAQDWTLEQCLDTAFVHNKNLLIHQNQVQLAEMKNQEAKAQLIPKVMLSGDYRYFTEIPYQYLPQEAFGGPEGVYRAIQFGVPHNIGANLNFRMPIYDPQIAGEIKVSETNQTLTSLQERKTKEQLVLEISTLYYNAQILKNKLEFIRQNRINGEKLESNTRLLYEQKVAGRTDVDKVVLQNQQLQLLEAQAESQYSAILQGLKFAMGLSLDHELEIPLQLVFTEEVRAEGVGTVDFKIQETREKLLDQELQTIRNSRLPSFSLYGSYGTTGFGYNGAPESFLDFYPVSFLGAQLSIPVFNGTITSKKIKQKELELTNSRIQKELVKDQNQLQIQTFGLQLEVSKIQIQTNQSQIQLAESIYNRTLMQQREGLASLTEVLLADNALRDSQQQYLNALVDYLKATLELKKSSGTILN
jgi:OMF family outer membrane factor